jgi:hypothetical protein
MLTAGAVETWRDEEARKLTELSPSTLMYMIVHGQALERWLRHHRIELGYRAEEEYDLLEAMRLSARLSRVESNIVRTGRVNAGIRAELLRRGARERKSAPMRPVGAVWGFTTDARHAKG